MKFEITVEPGKVTEAISTLQLVADREGELTKIDNQVGKALSVSRDVLKAISPLSERELGAVNDLVKIGEHVNRGVSSIRLDYAQIIKDKGIYSDKARHLTYALKTYLILAKYRALIDSEDHKKLSQLEKILG